MKPQPAHEFVAALIATQFGKKIKLTDAGQVKVRSCGDLVYAENSTSFEVRLSNGERLTVLVGKDL